MAPLSSDLRERIVAVVETGDFTLQDVADLFAVHLSTVVRLLQRYRRTGSVQPKPHGGGMPRKLDDPAVARLLELVKQQPDATLEELRDRLGVPCSLMTIFRALKAQRISRKKKTRHASERDTPRVQKQRREFRRKMASVHPEHQVFVDETGATTSMSRDYGRAPIGERVEATTPGVWKNVTLISALRGSGVVASLAFPGATDRPAFETYVEKVLVPELREGDVVVWDNLSPHRSAAAIASIEAAGARVEPLPVYSPDLSPIEEMFSKVKQGLRSLAARSIEGVMEAMGQVLNQITQNDILGWFRDRCGYALQT
jgi:transposase